MTQESGLKLLQYNEDLETKIYQLRGHLGKYWWLSILLSG